MGESEEKPATTPLGAFVPVTMYEQLREAAKLEDRSMSSIVRRAIAHELELEAEQAATS